MAIFVIRDSGKTELTITSNSELLKKITKIHVSARKKALEMKNFQGLCHKLVVSNNSEVIDKLYERGYRTDFKKYKCWILPDDLKNIFKGKQYKVILKNPEVKNEKSGYMKLLSSIVNKK